MIFAPLPAASSTSFVSFSRLAATSPRSDEHWTAATRTAAERQQAPPARRPAPPPPGGAGGSGVVPIGSGLSTGEPVVGFRVPHWEQIIAMSRQVSAAVGLGYVGVDIVLDEAEGPLLLEANARPGLAIQIANGRGLEARLRELDANRALTV